MKISSSKGTLPGQTLQIAFNDFATLLMISLTARVCWEHLVISLNQEKSIGNSSKFDGDFILLDCFDCIQVYFFWFA